MITWWEWLIIGYGLVTLVCTGLELSMIWHVYPEEVRKQKNIFIILLMSVLDSLMWFPNFCIAGFDALRITYFGWWLARKENRRYDALSEAQKVAEQAWRDAIEITQNGPIGL